MESTSHPGPPRGTALVVLAFALAAVSAGLGLGAIGPSLPLMHQRLHAPMGNLGLLLAGDYVGSLLATLVLGPFLDHWPPRPIILGALLLTACGFALLPLAETLPVAVAALCISGMGVGVCAVGAPVLLTRASGRPEGRALALVNMAFGAGAFLGPLCAGWAIDTLHDYRLIYFIFACTLIAPLLLLLPAPLAAPHPAHRRQTGPLPPGIWTATLLLALVSFLYLAAEVGFGTWAYTYVRATTHATVNLASAATSAFWLALSGASLGAALRPHAWRADRLILVCGAAASLAALLFLVAPTPPLQIGAALLVGICLGPIYPLNLGDAAHLYAPASGLLSTVVLCSSQFGGGLGPWVQGQVITRSAHLGIILTIGLCAALAGAQALFLAAEGRRHRVR